MWWHPVGTVFTLYHQSRLPLYLTTSQYTTSLIITLYGGIHNGIKYLLSLVYYDTNMEPLVNTKFTTGLLD